MMEIKLRDSWFLLALTSLIGGCGKGSEPAPGPFIPVDITLRESGELKELVDEKLVFIDQSGTQWVAPRGTLTDGASIPRILLPVTDGRWDREFLKAAVVHDAYCQSENETRTPEQYRKKPWRAVHRMFYEACLAGGTDGLLAKLMFAAVWLAGPRWDDSPSQIEQVSAEALTRGFVGSKNWIEENNPSIDEIVADLSRREPLLVDLHKLEVDIQAALQSSDTSTADQLLRQEDQMLSAQLSRSPNDLMLLSFKGSLHKNRAILNRSLNYDDAAAIELTKSEQAFKSVAEEQPRDPGALVGLGKVSILRGDYERGADFARQALEVAPEHEEARKDLLEIRRLRELPPLELQRQDTD